MAAARSLPPAPLLRAPFAAPPLAEPLPPCGCASHDSLAEGPKNGGPKGGGATKNVAPSAANDAFATDEATALLLDVLANDSDRNGDPLTVTHVAGQAIAVGQTVTLASGATLTLMAGGELFYDPGLAWLSLGWGESAVETFTYTISDGRGGVSSATARVTIAGIGEEPRNTAPVARNDSASTDERTAVSGDVLANDSDPDGDPIFVSAVNGSAAAVGQTIALASGAKLLLRADGVYSYDPNGAFNHLNAGQSATDSFTYRISDGRGGEAQATVSVAIAGISETTTPAYVSALVAGSSLRWNASQPLGAAATVTFTFLDSVPAYYSTSASERVGFTPFSAAQRDVTRKVLDDIAAFSNLGFAETTDVSKAAITFGIADLPGSTTGWAYYPSGTGVNSTAGDVWIDINYASRVWSDGSFAKMLLIHEIGHAVGLKHSTLLGTEDTRQFSVMSYNKHATMSPEPASMMVYDVAAIQHLYGADRTTRAGNDAYTFAQLNNKVTTIWDGGGVDTFDFSAATSAVTIDLRPGAFSTVASSGRNNVAIAHGTVIENARGGSGADLIVSNDADNVLTGGAGRDVFRFHPNWGRDTITDFARGADLIDLAPTGLAFSDLTLSFASDRVTVAHGANAIALLGLTFIDPTDFLFGAAA